MGLYDAMNASVTGMNAQSNYLSNIGQNISNASTVGYKRADTEFSTMVDQAAVGQTSAGGVNTTTRIDVARQGTPQGTTSSTDLAISGDGFFVVSNAGGEQFLTRAGSFVPDANGNLINAGGYYLNGYSLTNGAPTIVSNSLSGMQVVKINSAGLSAAPTTTGTLTANLPAAASTIGAANLPSANTATSTYTEKTSMVMYDSLGGSHTIDIYMAKSAANTWQFSAFDNSAATNGGFPYAGGALASQTATFSSSTGGLVSGGTLSIGVPSGSTMTLDMSAMTQLAGAYAISTSTVNGNAPSSVSSVSIASDGTLSYQLSNGSTVSAYTIPIANVASPDNLLPSTGNVFSPNILSGQVMVGTAGAGGLGTIHSSQLEQSTVDIATELTNMIVAQRSYQANTQVFKVGSELLNTLIQAAN